MKGRWDEPIFVGEGANKQERDRHDAETLIHRTERMSIEIEVSSFGIRQGTRICVC